MIKVIKADLSRLDELAPLFDAYRQFYKQDSNLDGSRQFLRERLENNESIILVAIDDKDDAVGFTQLYPWFSSTRLKRTWILNDLYVAASVRRQGVAKLLMDAAKDYAIETKNFALSLRTQISNLKAQALYEALGYVKDKDFYTYLLKV